MKKIVIRSYAKINLSLDITGIRDDGYHLLDMVMIPLELHDTLLVEETPRAVDNYITLDDFAVEESEFNTVSRAVGLINDKCNLETKFKIDLHKVIPMKAGLGGGSSNAAFVLKAINDYKKLNINEEDLNKMASQIGADVPFFIGCKPARCSGIGEVIKPITVKNDYFVLIIKPDKGCATKEVYRFADQIHNWPHGNVDDVIKALETGDDDLLAKSVFNVLEDSAIKIVPEIQTIKDELKQLGLEIVLMSGSGSSVYALSTNHKLIKKAFKVLEKKYNNIYLTKVIK